MAEENNTPANSALNTLTSVKIGSNITVVEALVLLWQKKHILLAFVFIAIFFNQYSEKYFLFLAVFIKFLLGNLDGVIV